MGRRRRDDTIKLVIRLPPALHRQLTRVATRKNQSLNSEMVQRLEMSFELEPGTIQYYRDLSRDMRALSEHMARQGRTDFFGTPFTVINEKLNRRIAELEAEESKDHGEKK